MKNMKYLPVTIRLRRGRRRGSVLVMAIVIITLLFIVGSTFLLTSRTNKQTVAAIDSTSSIDDGIDAVINRINTVLVEDLLGPAGGTATMLDGTAGNEYWDYPYTHPATPGTNDDMWLASMVPIRYKHPSSSQNFYFWTHVTDLYCNSFDLPLPPSGARYYSPASQLDSDSWQWSGLIPDNWPYWLNMSNTSNFARVIYDNQSTEVIVTGGNWNNPLDTRLWGAQADADGDGISDSYWVKIPDITGPDGKNLYAAVRIIDNCGMININTAYLNSTDTATGTKGSYLTDVSLDVMCPPSLFIPTDKPAERREMVNYIYKYRAQVDMPQPPTAPYEPKDDPLAPGFDPNEHDGIYYYNNSVLPFLDHRRLATVVPMGNPGDNFPLPFGLDDELELRNRFCLDSPTVIPLENVGTWSITQRYRPFFVLDPFDTGSDTVTTWYDNISWGNSPYFRRHMLTAYSWDRTMRGYSESTTAPVAGFASPRTSPPPLPPIPVTLENLQANINTATAEQIATALIYAYGSAYGIATERQTVAQLACNIVDYHDRNTGTGDPPSYLYYASTGSPGTQDTHVIGNEPHPFIRQVDINIVSDPNVNPNVFTVTFVNKYNTDISVNDLNSFRLHFYNSSSYDSVGSAIPLSFAGLMAKNTGTETISGLGTAGAFTDAGGGIYNVMLDTIALVRISNGVAFLIDKWQIPSIPPSVTIPFTASYDRNAIGPAELSVVQDKNYDIPNANFATVGEVTRVLTISPLEIPVVGSISNISGLLTVGEQMIVAGLTDHRLDITTTTDQDLLSRLTVLSRIDGADNNGVPDINNDGLPDPDDRRELAIPGRININTAPQKVIEALPWVVDSGTITIPPATAADREKLAQSIISYRDGIPITGGPTYTNADPGFQYTAELINVHDSACLDPYYSIRRHSDAATSDLTTMPDTTNNGGLGDGADDDLEERDVIFHRMSNLVTVRSDTFTAYIMVRLGELGPQKRVIAIFDRSNVFEKGDVPRLVALHSVPDPR